MSDVRADVQDAAVAVAVADQSDNLSAILQPGCAAAIWRRQPASDFQAWLDTLDPALLPQGRVILPPDAVRAVVTELCATAQTPQGPQCDQLIDDIAALAAIFADLMDAPYLRLRLQAVTSNACRKFHIDAMTARLICTYRGQGTQYGVSTDGQDPKRVFSVPTAAPIVLRGALWPDTPETGLLHRSPPIEGSGETRLVLVLDPMLGPEDDA